MSNFFSNSKVKIILIILSVILVIGAVVGIFAAIDKKSNETTKTLSPSFAVGTLDDTGKYKESKASIYTKNAFSCNGLVVTPDFTSTVKYKLYFYDYNGNFVSSTNLSADVYDDAVPINIKECRIVITPTADENISWYEVSKYAKQLTVKVSKTQYTSLETRLQQYNCQSFAKMSKLTVTTFGAGIYNSTNQGLTSDTSNTNFWYNPITLTDYSKVCVKYLKSSYEANEKVVFYKMGQAEATSVTPTEVGHFFDGDFVYVIVDTSAMTGSYAFHTTTTSASSTLFEFYA